MSKDEQKPPVTDGWVYRPIFVIPLVIIALAAIVTPAIGLVNKGFNPGSRKKKRRP